MLRKKEQTNYLIKVFFAIVFVIIIISYYYANCDVSKRRNPKLMSSPNAQYQRPMEYLVWNENCHIPSMDPFAAHYMKNYKEEIGPICSTKPALVSKSFNNSTKLYSVKVHMEYKHLYLKGTSTDDDIKCCYRQVLRRGDQRFK